MTENNANVSFENRLDECISGIAKQEGYLNHEVFRNKMSPDGGNYLGVLHEINIKGDTATGFKETSIFCKAMTEEVIDLGFVSTPNLYKKEIFFYKELTNVINELQEEANIPENERFNMVKFYDVFDEKALLMDNLGRRGYKTWNRMDTVTLDMAEACIKQLARFHGISFAINQLRPNYFENKIKTIKTSYLFNSELDNFCDKFYKIVMDYLDDEVKSKVGDKVRDILRKFIKYNDDKPTEYFCLRHGDFRPNNVMVKEQEGKVIDAVSIDYQLMYYSCPVLDFFYFIYLATDYDFRRNHMNHLKDLYYDSLNVYLQHFKIPIGKVFPRKVFEQVYEEKWDYGIIVGFYNCPFLFVSGDEVQVAPATDKDAKECISDMSFMFDEKFKYRIRGIIQDYIDKGAL